MRPGERQAPSEMEGTSPRRTVLYTWGDPSLLGREVGEDAPANVPAPAANFGSASSTSSSSASVAYLSLGATHGAFTTDGGAVWTWGLGASGRLGHGDERKYRDPTLVQSLAKQAVKAKSVSCGFFHTMMLSSKGQVYTCGRGYKGFLGHKNQTNIRTFQLVDALKSLKVVQVCAARNHSLVLTADGEVYSFGFPKHGRLGHGDDAYRRLPTVIQALKGHKVVQVSCIGAHNAALTEDGQVFTWGSGNDGRLGQGDELSHYAPVLVTTLNGKGVKTVACGYDFTAALTIEGHLFTWGNGQHGKLGHGDTENRNVPTLVQALEEVPIRDIACGANHTAAISTANVLYTWGKNSEGQLGHGDKEDKRIPTAITTLLSASAPSQDHGSASLRGRVLRVACGANHTAALIRPHLGTTANAFVMLPGLSPPTTKIYDPNRNKMDAQEIVKLLDMQPHPEGGFYKETFRAAAPEGQRSTCTAIYFLLAEGQRSHWHKVDAVETWLWHSGAPLELSISEDGQTTTSVILGSDLMAGQRPQGVVPKDAWQAARTLGKWTLVSCIVAPGFEFAGFTLAPPDWKPSSHS